MKVNGSKYIFLVLNVYDILLTTNYIYYAIWLRNFISTLEVVHSISRPLKLFCDNSAIISFSRNTRSTSRSKHIDMKFFFVKEKL